ncbi:RMD1 family protein [Methylocystis parvus]|uniref:RMD1 family protein n=1 Tax=Methylocystis parvus TaxID=134 RepID=A0A6B8M5B2_9HYPH|nr:RMD1 family protein [Methylocystis parvus]QGM99174.1 RMD1 family protein [Methylocystis parvus]WBK00452.1 RMD1 family protein [Methylocystis parvus OBBP]
MTDIGYRDASTATQTITARALLLGERIDTMGLERADLVSTAPLAFHAGQAGFAVLYRFGVAVLFGLSPLEEDEIVTKIGARVAGASRGDDETLVIETAHEGEDKALPNGRLAVKDLSEARLLVIADALAKSVALARDERRVNAVFDTVEPFAAELASKGRPPWRRKAMLELIGQTLLVRHRVSGRVAVEDKPDVLWDRPDLERLYARLEDEYELEARGRTLNAKIDVIGETARALTDLIDADRSVRLEWIIIVLIAMEFGLSLFQIFVDQRPKAQHAASASAPIAAPESHLKLGN